MRTLRSKLVGLLATTATCTAGLAVVAAPPADAAPTDVVISELMYHAASDLDGDDFLELTNTGTTPVDLSGWVFTGVTLTLPAGTTIAPGGMLVVAKDATQFQSTYGFAPAAVYGGNLANSGETVALRDAGGATIDTVSFLDIDPWPSTPDGLGPSLELVDATLNNDDPLNWAAATNPAGHTAGAANSVRRTGLGPRITGVTATPAVPQAGQPTTVSATITGQNSAVLRYRINFAAEQTVAMTSAGADTFSATIPGTAAGDLIRYRVEATNAVTTSRHPRIDDTIDYHGVVVPHAISSAIPVLEWFISNADYNTMVSNPEAEISRTAAIAYDGVVIDNVEVEIKGHASQRDPKVSWKFHMPQGHDFDMGGLLLEPVDEFDMQADWSDKSHGRSILAWDAYQRAGMANHQMFPIRSQRNGAFQGLYNFNEVFDGTWREREGYEDHQFFESETSAFTQSRPISVRFSKKSPDDNDFSPLSTFVNGIALTGTAQRNHLLGSADLPEMINYAAVTAIIEHVDSSSKNFYLVQDPVTTRWSILPWDLDHTWGNGCCNVDSTFVTPAEPGDNTSALMRALLAVPQWREMYFRRLRTLINDLLATGRMEALYDAEVGVAQPEIALDFARWVYDETESYSQQRNLLFKGITRRREAFAADPRVPGNQPATPNIVINEIQHSPTGGDTAEFVELYNPNNQAIDLSAWAITGGVNLPIQPGTVILPQQTMTFVSNDPGFRAAYSPTVFVGDRYSGNLAASATLTLTRPDGSTADQVTYGGAGWPTPTGGQSLELTDPAADNNDGANWALSSGPGTPGSSSGGTVITVPDAPTIGTATPANASATVTWTAPGNNGGSAITGYQVRVVNTAGTQVGALRPAGAGVTSLTVTGLTNGTAYRFQVAATNSIGTGAFSALSNSVTPNASATVPGPPVIGTPSQGAVGGELTAIARWTPPTTTGGSAITGYQVTALRMSSIAADATVLSRTTSRVLGAAVRQREFTLAAGNYRFEVVAINAIGTSPPSARSANVVPR
jgi:hypothetical protein